MQTATSIDQEISRLRSANQRLSEIWLGQAAASFIEKFESLMPQMQKLKEHLEAIYQKILAYADQMAGRDQADAGKFTAKFDLLADLNPLSVEKTASTLRAAHVIDQQIKDKKVTEKSEQTKKLKRQQVESQAALKELAQASLDNADVHLVQDGSGRVTSYTLDTETVINNLAGASLGGVAASKASVEGTESPYRNPDSRGADFSNISGAIPGSKGPDVNKSFNNGVSSPYGKGGTPNE